MTPLKQQISLIPFSIEHCKGYTGIALTNDGVLKIGEISIFLITDVLSVIESANLRQRQN